MKRVRRRWSSLRRRAIVRGHEAMDLDSDQLVALYKMYTNLMEEAVAGA